MDITFIGHNAMYFSGAGGLLLDPMLEKMYGDDYTSSAVEIYPPRAVAFDLIPTPGAIVISHEHSDHFQLTSLDRLSRDAVVYVGPLMPDTIRTCVAALGFTVVEVEFGQERRSGEVIFQLFPAGRDTALWESRVSQLYVRSAADPDYGGVYITVDALPSEMFFDQVSTGIWPVPTVFATSNNAQVTPRGVYDSMDNMVNSSTFVGSGQRSAIPGVDIIASLFDDALRDFPEISQADLLITGGGFLKDYEQMGPFPLSDQDCIAEAMGELVDGVAVYGPTPGDRFSLCDGRFTPLPEQAPWVQLDVDRWRELKTRRDAFIASDDTIAMKAILPPIDSQSSVEAAVTRVDHDLKTFVQLLLTSQWSSQLMSATVECRRASDLFLFRLTNGDDIYDWSLDLAESCFLPKPAASRDEDCVKHYPFGLIASLADWNAVITGHFQIWDIVGVAMRSWFPARYGTSPVIALYNGYGEQARPEFAYDIYRRQLSELLGERR